MTCFCSRVRKKVSPLMALFLVVLLAGCATPATYDYSALQQYKPRSILVLPPLNESVEVDAPSIYLSRVTKPLTERGYYVFPVAVIDRLMKENGLPSSAEIHQVSLEKIKEVINPDAVLYVVIEDWGQKYQVITSTAMVKVNARLIDVDTGTLLWEGKAEAVQQSGDGGAGLAGALVAALITQVINNTVDQTPQLAGMANYMMFYNQNVGLLEGPYRSKAPANAVAK